MTTSRAMLIAGISLGILALIILIAALSKRGSETPPVPAEVRSAPVAPSQSPARDPAPADDRATAGPVELPDPARAAAGPITFCFPGIVPGPGDCAAREEIVSLSGKIVGLKGEGGKAAALTVEMVHPDDASTPTKTVSSCRDYLRLKSQGWGALTSAGMAASLKLNQFCGLIVMAERAAPASKGGLTGLTRETLESVPPGGWPGIGEAELDDPAIRRDEDDARVWRAEGDTLSVILREVAAADFDGDDRSEVLLHSAVAAKGGTARAGGYMLAEDGADGLVLTPADIY